MTLTFRARAAGTSLVRRPRPLGLAVDVVLALGGVVGATSRLRSAGRGLGRRSKRSAHDQSNQWLGLYGGNPLRKLTYFVASTIDDYIYIAAPDGDDPSGPGGVFVDEGDHVDALLWKAVSPTRPG